MTGRNKRTLKGFERASVRVVLPALLFLGTTIGVGFLQQVGAAGIMPGHGNSSGSNPSVISPAGGGLGLEDPSLSMPALAGQTDLSSIQVLPDGNVSSSLVDVPAASVKVSPTIWVKTSADTTLWSASQANAAAFTDVPANTILRVDGPLQDGRLPIYYVGDGLLRRPGSAWVDAGAAETVDAPAPGQIPGVDADASQPLPVWVQAHRATSLWSGPDDKALSLTDLPQWTFLKVAGVTRGGRLLVNYAGDYASRQPGIGWVDQAAVGPAGDPGQWLTNHRVTSMWSGVDSKAAKFSDLVQWSKLRIVSGAPTNADRIEVEFFGDGSTRAPGMAWVARADVGPITPPMPLPAGATIQPSNGTGTLAATQMESHTFASEDEFINSVGPAAQRSFKNTGVPASVTVAQAILESDWGRSRLTRQGNNLFGIKALGGPGSAGVVSMATWEHLDGSDVVVQAPFKAYFTLEQSIDDHGKFFTSNKRYANALAVASDAKQFAQKIQDDGYATDPSYAAKLVKLMDRYNLYRFDAK